MFDVRARIYKLYLFVFVFLFGNSEFVWDVFVLDAYLYHYVRMESSNVLGRNTYKLLLLLSFQTSTTLTHYYTVQYCEL